MIVGRAALIVNEGQRGVIDPAISFLQPIAAQAQARGIIPKIVRLADAFRAAGLPVIQAPVIHRADFRDVKTNSLLTAMSHKHKHLVEGGDEAAYVPELAPQPGDFQIVRSSGFIAACGTELDALLRRLDIQTVVLTGVSTNVAIPGNAIVAGELGYHVVVPEDCIAGSDPELHRVIVEQQLRMVARIVNSEDLIAALG
jgi:nicotinamidase-related amidase